MLGDGPEAAPAVVDLLRAAGGRLMVLGLVEHAGGEPDELSLQALTFARALRGRRPVARRSSPAAAPPRSRRARRHGVATVHVAEHDALATATRRGAGARGRRSCAERLGAAAVLAAGSDRGNEVLAHAAVRPAAARRQLHRGDARRRRRP